LAIFQAGNLNIDFFGVQHRTAPLHLIQLRNTAPDGLAFTLAASLLHQHLHLLHHGLFGVVAAVPTSIAAPFHRITIPAVVATDIVLAAVGIAGAAIVRAASIAIPSLGISAVL